MAEVASSPNPALPASVSVCRHCAQAVPLARRLATPPSLFCCAGCEAVYGLLTQSGLGRYYDLRANSASLRDARSVAQSAERFDYVDDPDFRAEAGIASDDPRLDCFLEGVHCTACVWLVERLPRLSSDVLESRLDLGRSTVHLRLKPGSNFGRVFELLTRLGYPPHPLLNDDAASELEKAESLRMLLRLAVAGAAAGNVMLFSIGLYAGVEGGLGALFRWLSLGVALPAFTWSALPFYRAAWGGLRARALTIDFPISLALLGGYGASFAAAWRGSNELYLDSLTGLIFLLLSTRYVLRRLQRARLDSSGLFRTFTPRKALRRDSTSGSWANVPVASLCSGDEIRIASNETVPADGVLLAESALVDFSVLTGESEPRRVPKGDPVFAGTRNLENDIELRLTTDARGSRLGRIAEAIARSPRQAPRSVRTADRAARWFVAATLALALGVIAVKLGSDPAEGFRRALCLIVVACPCALALATPLTLARAYRAAAASGILLKHPEQIDTLAEIRHVFFDKTGTLTRGQPVIEHWYWLEKVDIAATASAIYSLESRSQHPLAKAISEYFANAAGVRLQEVAKFEDLPGRGLRGEVAGRNLLIERLPETPSDGATWIRVMLDGTLVATASLRDDLRPDSMEVLSRLARHWRVTVLSGDGRHAVASLAERLRLDSNQWQSELSPEQKAALVAVTPRALMVGDGANDALALSKASVGVAVQGSLDVSVRAADVVLLRKGTAPVLRLLTIARETRRVLYRNYAFSIFYNAIGAYLALDGRIGPLFAAVVMPVSALTVFLSSTVGTRRLREAP